MCPRLLALSLRYRLRLGAGRALTPLSASSMMHGGAGGVARTLSLSATRATRAGYLHVPHHHVGCCAADIGTIIIVLLVPCAPAPAWHARNNGTVPLLHAFARTQVVQGSAQPVVQGGSCGGGNASTLALEGAIYNAGVQTPAMTLAFNRVEGMCTAYFTGTNFESERRAHRWDSRSLPDLQEYLITEFKHCACAHSSDRSPGVV